MIKISTVKIAARIDENLFKFVSEQEGKNFTDKLEKVIAKVSDNFIGDVVNLNNIKVLDNIEYDKNLWVNMNWLCNYILQEYIWTNLQYVQGWTGRKDEYKRGYCEAAIEIEFIVSQSRHSKKCDYLCRFKL
ncbi:hypothetical protein ACJDT4_13315 [Clostridium neuense]|uniref:Uncharacterized protein n=1 Tax=Clostridium neuense TaxID=1728934 RepID=A0ABW8TGV4_9CLOT